MAEPTAHSPSQQIAKMLERLDAAQSPAEQAAVVAEMAFEKMSEPMSLAARSCVILRWFDGFILEALVPKDTDLSGEAVLSALQDLPFVEKTTHGWRYHDQTREGLLLKLPPELLCKSAVLAIPAYLEQVDTSLEILYCLVVSGQVELSSSFLDDLLMERRYNQDWTGLGIVLETVGEAEALSFVNALPRTALHYVTSGLANSNKGKFDEAIRDYGQAIELDPEDAIIYNNRGAVHAKKTEIDEAIKDFDKAIKLDSKYASAYYNRGLTLYDKGKLDAAIEDYNTTIKLNPEYVDVYFNRGVALYDKGKLGAAIEDYNKAIELNPKDALIYNNRGLAHQAKGELETALRDFNKAVELNPEYTGAYNNRGNALAVLGHWAEAKASFKKVVLINPEAYLGFLSLANMARREGNNEVWQDSIEQARSLVDYSDLYNASCFESVAGNVEVAIGLLQQSIDNGTGDPEWAKQDPDLEWIRDDPRFWEIVDNK